ncbi:SDR family NAD(P)-dependent oxidoreductase [Pseudonocardia acaciae]|uniref:SDR family NAD(P)-dependent oxidoreductase n=1 Tax=Pseudonocardia acaciae TaxID=551276 RepID=UPI00055EDC98|nr:SDR family oxidoreductase [Pseudonocardia acaciae]
MADGGVAVVTGAGSGIGRACARALAARGLPVYCVGRRPEPLERTAEMIGELATVVPADIGTEAGVASVREAVSGEVRALVHAAAIEGVASLAGTGRKEFDELVGVNLGGPFFLTQALEPVFAEGAGVVFVGSIAAVRGRARHAAYAATKAGLLGLTVNLAAELAPRVRVNCVNPGGVQTPMFEQAVAEVLGAMDEEEAARTITAEQARMLLGRIAEPEELAASIVHLALDAGYCTGSVLAVDGGYTAR